MAEISRASGRSAQPAVQPSQAVAVRTPAEAAAAAYEHSLAAKMAYAKTLAVSGLLPKVYQRSPGNVLFALEYGEALGISPIAAMMGIYVIDGRPTASAGLISGLVRKAGHRLRVTGTDLSATCRITRSDDPEFVFEATWTMDRAQKAGITGKQVWKQYPAAMLKARAITECARAACPDVLYGLVYTPEELGADTADFELLPGTGLEDGEAGTSSPARHVRILRVIAENFSRLGVDDPERMREIASQVIQRDLPDASAMDDDEAEFLLESLQNSATLEELLAEDAATGGEGE